MSSGGENNRRASVDAAYSRPQESDDSYFTSHLQAPQPGRFHRRPTNINEKAAKRATKQGDDGAGAFVDLQGGLAITLNMEISPQDPAGITVPYKLLVPALHYEGTEYDPPPTQVVKGWRKWLNIPRRKKPTKEEPSDEEPEDYQDHDTINNTRANAATSAHQYEGYGEGEDEVYSDEEHPQQLPPNPHADVSPESPGFYEEEPNPNKRKKWFGMI